MPQYVEAYGQTIEFPDGMSQDDIATALKQNALSITPKTANNSLGAQAGLALRSTMRGLAGIPQLVTEPIRQMVVNPLARLAGLPQASSLSDAAGSLADAVGLPAPDTPLQRIVDKGVEFGTGSAGFAGAAGALSNATSGGVSKALGLLAAGPGTQAVAGTSAGMAGEQAKESGGGPIDQFTSSVLGGLGGAGVMGLAKAGAGAVNAMLQPRQPVDAKIIQILIQQGVDPATIGPAVLSKMREDVSKAMNMGQLDDAAVARLADYARTGATPTRGPVTLDPYTVTQQQNAMKVAAATGSRDARLPAIAQANNQRLIQSLTELGPNPDSFAAGVAATGSISAKDAALKAAESALYDKARGIYGGEIPLQRKPFMDAIFGSLQKSNMMRFLPPEVGSMIDDISKGVIKGGDGAMYEVPFDVNALDNLKTVIAKAQRSTQDGNAKFALSTVRNALDSVPIAPMKNEFGGGQVVTDGGAAFLKQQDGQAKQVMDALNEARQAAWQRRQWQESAPGIEAALSGANGTTFVQQNVISKAADPRDVAKLVASLDPGAVDQVRGAVAQHLLESAIGAGKQPSAANFSGPELAKAIQNIGDRKLALFFTPDELETIKSASRVGTYETFQPRGSAVNNSSSGAAVAAMVQGLSKYLKPLKAFPLGAELVTNPLDYLTVKAAERPALNLAPGLINASQKPAPGSFAAGLLGPSAYGLSLLSATQ